MDRKGEFVFNKNYPDPKGMIDDLHDEQLPPDDFGLAILRSRLGDLRLHGQARALHRQDPRRAPYHPAGMAVYDATNPEARKYYWDLMNKALFRSAPTPGGWTRPNRRPRAGKTTFC